MGIEIKKAVIPVHKRNALRIIEELKRIEPACKDETSLNVLIRHLKGQVEDYEIDECFIKIQVNVRFDSSNLAPHSEGL